jgi:pre-mRNA 3'-end-processing factor FIP1
MTSAINAQKQETKQFEMMLAGQPGNGGQPGAMPLGMPGMGDMPPDMMNAMFASMNAQGVNDPSQLDFGNFMQQMQSMGGGPGGPAAQPGYAGQQMQQQNSTQGFGGQQHGQSYQQQQGGQGFGGGTPQPQGQGQPQGFEGYSSQQLALMQGGNGPPQGPAGGRGRGRGRRW